MKQRIFNLTLAVIGLAACLGCGDDEYELPKEYRESYISCYYPITGLNLYPPTVKSMSGPLDFSWQFEDRMDIIYSILSTVAIANLPNATEIRATTAMS